MASLHAVGKDRCELVVGARHRFSLRREALAMLLFPDVGANVRRVPLIKGKDDVAGDVTLSPSGRTLTVRLHELGRLYLAGVDDVRAFLGRRIQTVELIDATEEAPDAPIATRSTETAAQRTARLADAAARMRERLGGS